MLNYLINENDQLCRILIHVGKSINDKKHFILQSQLTMNVQCGLEISRFDICKCLVIKVSTPH